MMRLKQMALPSRAVLVLLLGLLVGLSVVVAGVSTHARAHPASIITVSNCSTESALSTAIGSAMPGDTINFSCSGTIPITAVVVITKNLTLDGSGQNVTLDGGGTIPVLNVSSGIQFTLKHLTIADGSAFQGGGLINGGTVTITNSTFDHNSALAGGGGIINEGTLTITNSTFANNSTGFIGGGLDNFGGTVTITNSTFDHNSATIGGGGLDNNTGTVTITNSTFDHNSVSSDNGGGLDNGVGTVTITNSTFDHNSALASGGGLANFGTVTIAFSTFANNSASPSNGGGLDNGGTLTLEASIVANNTGGNCSGTLTDQGYNLESATDCGFTGTGDLQNTDPKLDPSGLQNNGGPTQTIALLATSPAIDHVPAASCPATDQRGMSRPDDTETTCDIGAYESAPADSDLGLSGLPANVTTDATSPQGAVVTYTLPAAVDESGDSPGPSVNCTPASGSTFPIGTTTVTCTVTDSDDTPSTVSGSFQVVVKGAAEQISDLISLINSFNLSPQGIQTSFDSQLQAVQTDLAANNTAQACSDLTSFINHVKAQSGKMLTVAQANQLLAAATRIQAVLGC